MQLKTQKSRRRALQDRQKRQKLTHVTKAPEVKSNLQNLIEPGQENQKLKDKKPLLALASLLLLGGVGVTLAYYSDTSVITHPMHTSNFAVQTTLTSYQLGNLTPGQEIQEHFRTTNLGDTDIALRYYYVAQWTDADGTPLPLGAYLPDDQEMYEPVLLMSVEPDYATRNFGSGDLRAPWLFASSSTTYCADPTVVTDPEHYSCNEETTDITQAYSVISGPFYYTKALKKDETTVWTPFQNFVYTGRLANQKTVTTVSCYPYDSMMDFCPSQEEDYGDHWQTVEGIADFSSRESSGTLIRTVDYANDYSGATYNFSLIAESVEFAHHIDLWHPSGVSISEV